jgi:hypothetical protein
MINKTLLRPFLRAVAVASPLVCASTWAAPQKPDIAFEDPTRPVYHLVSQSKR